MKLKQYIKKLQKLAEKYPDAELIYAHDDEGNGYGRVIYDPAYRLWDGEDNVYEENDELPDDVDFKKVVVIN